MSCKKQFYLAFSFIVILILVLAVAGCGGQKQKTAPAGSKQAVKTNSTDNKAIATGQEQQASPAVAASTIEIAKISCAGCHEMLPEVVTWQVSSHSKVSCETCHPVKEGQYQAKHDKNSFAKPIKLAGAFPDQICEQCHSPNRQVTPSGDLIIPHSRHETAGIGCVNCHAAVVHAGIPERELTVDGELADFQAWTPVKAHTVTQTPFVRPSMWTCLNCHKSKNVTTKCAACHTVMTSLPSHEQGAWKTDHGLDGRKDNSGCVSCHTPKGEKLNVVAVTGDKIADFARVNKFCYQCHLQRPANHPEDWLPNHPQRAISRGRQNCYACHDLNRPASGAKVTDTYCNECHWFGKTPAGVAATESSSRS